MDKPVLIDVRTEIFADGEKSAEEIRAALQQGQTFMINVLGSPGCGKTSFLLGTLDILRKKRRCVVLEGDLDSMVDSEKILRAGVRAVQINTGGCCHLDAVVVRRALETFDPAEFDAVFVENIGNLVCPAEFDIGENLKVMLLSVPEGDDKILKYPLMFSVADVLIINKIDYLPDAGFSVKKLRARCRMLHPEMRVFEVSCRTGEGLEAWCAYLDGLLSAATHYRG